MIPIIKILENTHLSVVTDLWFPENAGKGWEVG